MVGSEQVGRPTHAMLGQPVTIYEVVPEPTAQTTITDVVFGAVWLVGALGVVAVVLGVGCAWLLVRLREKRRHDNNRDGTGGTGATELGLNTR